MTVGKKTIVLDIDENLIHSVVWPKANPSLMKETDFHFQLHGDQYYVYKRPGLDNFLNTVFKEFDYIGFWTTGVKPYAKNILKHILNINQAKSNKLVFINTRGDCPRDSFGYYKPLKKVWRTSKKFRPRNTIMMDNTLIVMRDNLNNALLTPSYDEDNVNFKTDKYLPWLDLQIQKNLKNMTALEFVKKFTKPKK